MAAATYNAIDALLRLLFCLLLVITNRNKGGGCLKRVMQGLESLSGESMPDTLSGMGETDKPKFSDEARLKGYGILDG